MVFLKYSSFLRIKYIAICNRYEYAVEGNSRDWRGSSNGGQEALAGYSSSSSCMEGCGVRLDRMGQAAGSGGRRPSATVAVQVAAAGRGLQRQRQLAEEGLDAGRC